MTSTPTESNIIIYSSPNGDTKVNVMYEGDTVWLTQKRMAELFGVTPQNITIHLKSIYESVELLEAATCKKFLQVQKEGDRTVTRELVFYNLDAIISVGYRVNSTQATQFRIWATNTLREYIIKGFVMDDNRLKQGQQYGKDYFKELLERVRSIRASERRIYQQITDIFAECSIDYNKQSETKKDFYAGIQNKFHFAITGHTAAEIIYNVADSTKPHMALTTWKNSPKDRILKSDTMIAKNYLSATEIKSLERAITGFFDYIEGLIERNKTFTMEDFAASVNNFLSFNEYKILEGLGTVSHDKAQKKAFAEYEKFNIAQKIDSDFDQEVKKISKTI
jgi:hypothetical protein